MLGVFDEKCIYVYVYSDVATLLCFYLFTMPPVLHAILYYNGFHKQV